MAERKGHFLRKPGRATAPASLVSIIVTRQHDRELDGGTGVAIAEFRSAFVSAARIVRGRWSVPERHCFQHRAEFWRWLLRWAPEGRKTYIVAPTASDALTLLEFWDEVDCRGAAWTKGFAGAAGADAPPRAARDFLFRRLVLKGAPDVIDYTVDDRSYCWLSCRNYFTGDLADVIDPATVQARLGKRRGVAAHAHPDDPAAVRADEQLAAMESLSDWWLALKAGAWACTAGSMAERFLRSRMDGPKVVVHKHEPTMRLERLAAHRGRVSCWFYGTARGRAATPDDIGGVPPGPFPELSSALIHIDIRSAYPWLLSTTKLPVRLLSYRDRCEVKELLELTAHNVATAAVRLNTPVAEYPHRGKDRIDYPTGKFTAYLSGVELRRALTDGIVEKVHEAAIYQAGMPFQRAAEELLELRRMAIASNNGGWELFVKLLSNSMTGKFNQRRCRWVERPQMMAERRWGAWPDVNANTGEVRRFRGLAGLVWEQLREEGGKGTLSACYGHLTAACSARMRLLRETLPARTVVSQDTDGFWCLPECEGLLRAAGWEFGGDPGQLRVTGRSEYSRFWGPKHYWAKRAWKLSGLHNPTPHGDGLRFLDRTSSNAIRQSPLRAPRHVADAVREVTLNLMPGESGVGADGWVASQPPPPPAPTKQGCLTSLFPSEAA